MLPAVPSSLKPRLAALLVLASLAVPARAEGSIAAYPILPPGLSSITVRDARGRYVGRILPQRRYWVPMERIPAFLQQALLAVEDARYYEHGGIDLKGIARAFMKDVFKGKLVEGGSTITQQLVKNKFLNSERTLDRKLKEASLAMELEKNYSKRQILEMYFNEIYFGNGAQGLPAAARLYFDKSPEELTEGECVLLAGIPKNPNRYNPFAKSGDAAGRRAVVVRRMLELNLITPQKAKALQSQPIPSRLQAQAPQYLGRIRAQLQERFGADVLEQGGLDVVAAVDLDLQKAAEQALREGVRRLSPDLQGALVCEDPVTGDVLAAVGDVDGGQNGLNRAFVSRRQPGSAIKPLIYAAALEDGITAGSLWNDDPVAYDRGNGQSWRPLNFGKERFGVQSLRQALANSNNIITVKLLDTLGIPYFVGTAGRMGLPLSTQSGLSLALGTDVVTLADLVQAYTPFATNGVRAEARTILRIYDRRRQTWTEVPPARAQVLSEGAAFITAQMMKDVLVYGTAKSLRGFSRAHPSAGKTGTTDDHVDAWFVGFTPSLVTGVWIGYDRPRPGGPGFTGGTAAAPIWGRFMGRAAAARPAGDFPCPETVLSRTIDPATGLAARQGCPKREAEFFIAGTEPGPCTLHEGEPLEPPAQEIPEEPAPEPAP
jgi:1A family penicillin-binding protein